MGVLDGKRYVGTDVENTGPERMVKVDADKNCIEMCILGLFCDFWKVPKVFEESPKSSKSPESSKRGCCDSAL